MSGPRRTPVADPRAPEQEESSPFADRDGGLVVEPGSVDRGDDPSVDADTGAGAEPATASTPSPRAGRIRPDDDERGARPEPGRGDGRPSILVPVGLWLGFVALAVTTYVSWEVQDLYRVVGDEPHYLVMADGIIEDLTFEQTETYEREFTEQVIYPGGLAPAGSAATPETTHALVGPNGLYNVHNIGLPLLLAVPWALGGEPAVKLGLLAGVSLLVPLAWRFSGRFSGDTRIRALSTMAATWSLPFILGANQVFPDLPGGVLALIGIDRVFALAGARPARPSSSEGVGGSAARIRSRGDVAAVAAVAYLPWLQIKFAAAALLVAAALTIEWRRAGRSLGVIAGSLAPVGLSLGLLALYNLRAFGKASGPYSDGALEVSVHSMSVLAGLHLDRFQGVLIQNPAYLAGILFAVPFVRRAWLPGGLVVLTYASFVVPNALHPAWYGGTAFAGRFFWSGAVVALPAVIYGLVRLGDLGRRFWQVLVAASLSAGALTWSGLLVGPGDLYNRNPELWYPALFPVGERFLPAFRDPELAFRLGTNLVFLGLVAGLLLAGFLFLERNDQASAGAAAPASDGGRLRFAVVAVGLAAVGAIGVVLAGLVDPYREPPMGWTGAQMPSDIGSIDGAARTATAADGPGFVTFGPYVGLWLDDYLYRVTLEAERSDGGVVGVVEVRSSQTGTIFASHEVRPTTPDQPTVIEGRFFVPDRLENQLLEVRTLFHGDGELTVHSVELLAP